MADQQPINAGQIGTSMQGDEVVEDQTTTHFVQMEMLKALKDACDGQWLMMSMMIEMQKQREELKNLC